MDLEVVAAVSFLHAASPVLAKTPPACAFYVVFPAIKDVSGTMSTQLIHAYGAQLAAVDTRLKWLHDA